MIALYTRNILETGTVTVTGTPDAGYPEARLYDRHISLYWKDTVTEAKVFQIDQGAANILAVDFLAIEKHNFNGKVMSWEYSDNNIDWTAAVIGWTQGDNNQIIKTLGAALTHQYWKVTVASIANPQCSEIFMSYGYEFDYIEKSPYSLTDQDNVVWVPSIGGLERSTKFGEERWVKGYEVYFTGTQRTNFESAMGDLDSYSKPFYLKDDEDNYGLCRLLQVPSKIFDGENYVAVDIKVIEEL